MTAVSLAQNIVFFIGAFVGGFLGVYCAIRYYQATLDALDIRVSHLELQMRERELAERYS